MSARHARTRGRGAAAALAACAALGATLGAARAGAQDAATSAAAVPDSTPRWAGTAAASANLLFGAADQRVLDGRLTAGRAGRVHAVRAELQGGYGDALGPEQDAVRRVIVRNVRLSAGWDRNPTARVSPFAFALVETSLQQRLALRTSGGAGAKYTFWRGAATEDLSVSLAVLAEETRALERPDVPSGAAGGEGTRVRASLRLRARRRLDDRWRVAHVTFWQPTLGAARRTTVETTTEVAHALRAGLDLTATLRDRFDTEARRRGARSNHDGQLLLGVRAAF